MTVIPERKLVGAIGFEPTTLWSQTRCAARLRYAPRSGDKGIRTLDLLRAKQMLSQLSYIPEKWAHQDSNLEPAD